MNNKKDHFSIARLLGLSPNILDKCSSHLKERSKVTLYAMIVLHAFTAGMICLGLSKLFPVIVAVLAFPILFTVLFTADRLLITGARHWSSTAARALIVIVLPILNMVFFDLAFFDSDIKLLHDQKKIEHASEVAKPFKEQIRAINQKQQFITGQINELDSIILACHMMLIKESDGTGGSGTAGIGPIYDQKQIDTENLMNNAELKKSELKESLAQWSKKESIQNERMQVAMRNWQEYESTGLLYRLELLHEKLFYGDKSTLRFFSIAYFCVFLFFDMLLVLPAVYLPFREYTTNVEADIHQKQLIREFKDSQLFKYHSTEVQVDIEKKLAQLESEAEVEYASVKLRQIEAQLMEELKMIELLQKEDEAAKVKFQEDYELMAKVAILRSLDQIEDLIESKSDEA